MAVKTTAAKKAKEVEDFDALCRQMIERALFLESEIAPMEKELKEIKDFFKALGTDEGTKQEFRTSAGIAILTIANKYSVDAKLIPDLKALFKRSYKDYVIDKTSYGATAKFKELVNDGDYTHKELVRSALLISTSASVAFKGLVQNKPKLVK